MLPLCCAEDFRNVEGSKARSKCISVTKYYLFKISVLKVVFYSVIAADMIHEALFVHELLDNSLSAEVVSSVGWFWCPF